MLGVPQLAGDENVFPLQSVFELLCQGGADLLVVRHKHDLIMVPTSTSLPYTAAQSIWRYPISMAAIQAASTWPGLDCQVPRPSSGISAPVLSFTVLAILELGKVEITPVSGNVSLRYAATSNMLVKRCQYPEYRHGT